MKRPSFQFYPADWRTDSSLKVCSLSARGLWVEMLCLMHELGQQEGSRYGYLELRGKKLTNQQLSRLVGVPEESLNVLLEELEEAGVFSLDDKQTIFSRRLLRDESLKQKRAEAGSKGGSKSKAKAKQNNVPSRVGARTEDEDEVEEEVEEENGKTKKLTNAQCWEIIELYNQTCPSLPRCVQLTKQRMRAINARAKEKLNFKKLFEMAEASEFLKGQKTEFKASFGWLMNEENATKVLEGMYVGNKKEVNYDAENPFG